MKKILLITAIILTVVSQKAYSLDDAETFQKFTDSENLEQFFYQAPVKQTEPKNDKKTETQTVYPLFKQMRIRLTNFYNEKSYQHDQKMMKKEAERVKKEQEEYFKDLDENTKEILKQAEAEEAEVKKDDTTSEDNLKLEGGVKEQVTTKDAQLDADKIRFNEETMDIIATGKPVLYFPPQKTTIKAKKMVYNHASNILKAYDNVEVIKDGQKSYGDYLELNMNEEYGFMDNVKTKASFLTVNARKADMDEKQIVLYDGEMVSEHSFILRVETDMVGGRELRNIFVGEDDKSRLTDIIGDTKVNIQSDEIIVNAKEYNDTITLKKSKIKYGDVELFKIPSMTFHTNKNHNYFEANYPEFGSRSRIGMFAGPGFVFDTPLQKGSSVKIIPILNYGNSKFGFGGFGRYHSATNQTDLGYVTTFDTIVLNGKQQLDDKLYMQYGMNSYMDEWFLGYRMAKYDAELIYHDEIKVPQTLSENLGLTFKHRAGLGFMHDNDYKNSSDSYRKTTMSTMRARYMASLSQDLFKYENPKESIFFKGGIMMQGSAAVYGSGDTQFIGRVGPYVEHQYKRWFQSLRYLVSAYEDNSPMRAYDGYRYGHATFNVREAFRICKYLTVAWSGTFNVLRDTADGRLLRENAFILMIGPDDFKIHLGYDWEREQTYVACVVAMDTKGSSLGYKKLVIKNPERLANNDLKQPELKVFDNLEEDKNKPKTKKRMMYAEVIDIEDPNKEQI